MLKKAASGVLASLRVSTYRSVRLASSLAAALLDSLFEHPGWCAPVIQTYRPMKFRHAHRIFPQPVRDCRPHSDTRRNLRTDQIFSQGISKTHEPVGDGMSQQGAGQRKTHQTKHAEYVTREGHPRSFVLL